MSAWRKQAIPLIFIENGMRAIAKGIITENPIFNEILRDFNIATAKCWKLTRQKNLNDEAVLKLTVKTAKEIQDGLRDVWGEQNGDCIGELSTAMLAISDDTYRQIPNDKKPAWNEIITVCNRLCELAGTDEIDDECFNLAIRITNIVTTAAKQ